MILHPLSICLRQDEIRLRAMMKLSVALSFVLLSVISLSTAVVYPTCTCEKPPVCNGKVNRQWNQLNTRNYLWKYIPSSKEQTALTFCFFYGPNAQGPLQAATDPNKDALLINAGNPDLNSWVIGFHNGKFGMNGESSENLISDNLEAFTEPHRHCFVWKRNEYMKWFYDKNTPGKVELAAEVGDSGRNRFPANSVIVLLNEDHMFGRGGGGTARDTVGGGLDSHMMPGLVADFQIWDSAGSEAEVLRTECGEKGNLISFDDFEIIGTQEMEENSGFECCQS